MTSTSSMDCPCCINRINFSSPFDDLLDVNLTYQGKSHLIKASASAATGFDLHKMTLHVIFGLDIDGDDNDTDDSSAELLKLLYKGKRIAAQPDIYPFEGVTAKKKPLKVMVMATNASAIKELSIKRSDPLIRGFDQEKDMNERRIAGEQKNFWGDIMKPHKDYKFGRLRACTDQSFGTRSTESTPHAFRALELLQKLSTDPGIIAMMKERELVVGTLGEMDPIDDRIMQKTEAKGGCLLGYNTNRGLRIDIKLRTDDLSDFRPYPQLVSTLIHELSHNWVGEHTLLFWTNYSQMRAEYLCTHARLRYSSYVVGGKKLSELAGLNEKVLNNVFGLLMNELQRDMAQFGLHPNMIANPLQQRIAELEKETLQVNQSQFEHRLGGGGGCGESKNNRQLALAAAERRARSEQQQSKRKGGK